MDGSNSVGDTTLFDVSPLGMAVIETVSGEQATIVEVNPALAAIFRCTEGQLLGRDLRELLGRDPLQLPDPDRPSPVVAERSLMLSDGSDICMRWHLVAWPKEGARNSRLLAQVEDVTDQRCAEQQVRRQARLLELVPEPVITRAFDGTILSWNAGAEQVYGYTAERAVGRRTHDLLETDFGLYSLAEVEHDLAAVGSWSGQIRHRRADGRVLHIASKHVRDDREDGELVVLEINVDVTERVATQQALAASEAKYRSQFAFSAVGQLIWRLDGTIENVNPALAAMLGYEVADLVGTSVARLCNPSAGCVREFSVDAFVGAALDTEDPVDGEGVLIRADGARLPVDMNISAARGVHGQVQHVIAVFQDISARKIIERELHRLALHDPLTGLANRALLGNRLDQALNDAGQIRHSVGLLFLDLDGFKSINDTFGHDVGDAVLEEVAARLTRCVRGGDTVARFGGDEFVVLCPRLTAPEDLYEVATRVLDRLAAPCEIAGRIVEGISASMGLTFPDIGGDATDALRQADRAMYTVKNARKNEMDTLPVRCGEFAPAHFAQLSA